MAIRLLSELPWISVAVFVRRRHPVFALRARKMLALITFARDAGDVATVAPVSCPTTFQTRSVALAGKPGQLSGAFAVALAD